MLQKPLFSLLIIHISSKKVLKWSQKCKIDTDKLNVMSTVEVRVRVLNAAKVVIQFTYISSKVLKMESKNTRSTQTS